MRTLAETFDPSRNSFNAVRLAAAVVVLVSHSYPLSGSIYEPFSAHLGHYDTGGGFAVSAFFIISGFLITRSAERRDWGGYFFSRILRLIPGLGVLLLIQAFVLGPLVTTTSFDAYIGGAVRSLQGLFLFPIPSALPGVFTDLPVPLVNGSLWTLPLEATMYGVVALWVALGLMTRFGSILIAGGLLAGYGAMLATGFNWGNQGPFLLPGVMLYAAVRLGAFFFLGAVFWTWKERIPMHPVIVAVAIIILKIAYIYPIKMLVYPLCFGYLIIWLCQLKAFDLQPLVGKVDISYGVYLYAFPIQQLVVMNYGVGVWAHTVTALALLPTLVFAYLSWTLIEHPAVRLKKLLRARREPSPDKRLNVKQ